MGKYIAFCLSNTVPTQSGKDFFYILVEKDLDTIKSKLISDEDFVNSMYVDNKEEFSLVIYQLISYISYFGGGLDGFWAATVLLSNHFEKLKTIGGIPNNKDKFDNMVFNMSMDVLDSLLELSDEFLDDLDEEE